MASPLYLTAAPSQGLAGMKNETIGSQTNSMGQKQCLYLRQGFLSSFSES